MIGEPSNQSFSSTDRKPDMTHLDMLAQPSAFRAALPDTDLPPLTRSQADVLTRAKLMLSSCDNFIVAGWAGRGKTLVLRHLHAELGGKFLTAEDGMRALNNAPADKLEEALLNLVVEALEDHDIVYFDDWDSMKWFGNFASDRPFHLLWRSVSLMTEVARAGKKFVSTHAAGHANYGRGSVGNWTTLPAYNVDDKKAVLEYYWGEAIDRREIETLELSYEGLNGYQLEAAGKVLREIHSGPVTAEALAGVLGNIADRSNTVLAEVENVSVRGLVGVDEQLEELDRTILIPMTQPALAKTLGMKPARGLLLYGPPGTGKTTIGRYLAHKMEGRFFIIDGTMIADETAFNESVTRLLNTAAASSPSVVFIDDADVIFRGGRAQGFARQLLTKLDGLASESQKEVCLVMTAMDVSDMPPAMVRSGRIEVWLEMKLPTLEQRAGILESYQKAVENPLSFDTLEAARLCEGFTPADLRGLIGDARALAAYDALTEAPARPLSAYLEEAAGEIAARKRLLATF